MSLKSIIDVIISPISLIVGDKIGHAITGVVLAGIGIATGQMWLVGIGLAMVSSSLGPTAPKLPSTNPGDRLQVTMEPTAPRKWAFGKTALATDLRYQSFSGSNQDTYNQIICVASHKVNSIYELWLDNEKAWDSTSGVASKFAGYLTVTTRTEGTSANGIAIDSTWTATCTLTGCAYIFVTYKLTDKSDKDRSPFSGGVSQRQTIRGKGALVYDPRLDSTVTGGSGSQRAATQSTWTWDDNASRNPALQLLWYLLGWQINSKLAVGMGLPPARIDLPSFITAANACDESVTLAAGGSEPRYRGDGVLSEGDDRQAVIETLCANMNATLRDAGGKLSLTVLKNDLASPVAAFTEADILVDGEFDQTPDLHQTFNIVRGRRIDPSDNALYQPVDFPEIKLTAPDGIDRIYSAEFMLCESNGQAQRLAKQKLQRNQYQGTYSFTGGERWWQVNIGDVVQQSHQGLGWSNKLFRLVSQSISRTGETRITLLEENAAIYVWAAEEAAAVVAGVPTIYDPLNSPILQGIITARTNTGTNELNDALFGTSWTLLAGTARKAADATLGYAKGNEPYYCELTPDVALVRSATSELVPVLPTQRIFFKLDCQRGTTLGTGSRLNPGHEWVQADGTTTTGSPAEGTQQTPSSLTAGAAPKSVYWSDVAPALAAFVRIKAYSPALASSSGTFRVEAPVISKIDLGGTPTVGYGPTSYAADYAADGTAQSGELPFSLVYQMYLGGVAQTAGVTWTYKVVTGGVNSKTSADGSQSMSGTGAGTFTGTTLDNDSSTIEITATASNGSSAKLVVTLTKTYAVAVGSGGSSGDAPAQTSGFTSINSTSFVAVSNVLTYTVPTGQTSITNTASLRFQPDPISGTGSWTVEMKVQRLIGATWTDQGATFSGGTSVTADPETGALLGHGITLSGTRQSTGLTAGTQYSERLVARLTSGARTHNLSGSTSVAAP